MLIAHEAGYLADTTGILEKTAEIGRLPNGLLNSLTTANRQLTTVNRQLPTVN